VLWGDSDLSRIPNSNRVTDDGNLITAVEDIVAETVRQEIAQLQLDSLFNNMSFTLLWTVRCCWTKVEELAGKVDKVRSNSYWKRLRECLHTK